MLFPLSYVPLGAILMSKKVADGIRDSSGFWPHGHTYQVSSVEADDVGLPYILN